MSPFVGKKTLVFTNRLKRGFDQFWMSWERDLFILLKNSGLSDFLPFFFPLSLENVINDVGSKVVAWADENWMEKARRNLYWTITKALS